MNVSRIPKLGKVVLNAQSVEITHIPEAASVHHRLDDAVEQVFQPMRHVIVECLVEIFAPLCNPSFLPLVLGVRPVKCGELRLCGLCCGVSLLVMVNSRIGHECPPMPSARRAVRARSGHKLTISPTVAIQFWRCGSRHRNRPFSPPDFDR
jgi:hypothetical protein